MKYYTSNLSQIIKLQQFYKKMFILKNKYCTKIQSLYRKYNIFRRKKCNNLTSCITLDTIYNIPCIYFYVLYDKICDKYFGFDIRNLNKMISNKSINPYTNNTLNKDEINNIHKKFNYVQNRKYNIEVIKAKLNVKQKLRGCVINTFHKIDMLGNYTDIKWFMDLSVHNLHRLYYESLDIFHYRAGLTLANKKKYVPNGRVFMTNCAQIYKILDKDKLRYIMINEYNKFLDFNNDVNDKKTSCLWILSALVRVSIDARNALPHLNN